MECASAGPELLHHGAIHELHAQVLGLGTSSAVTMMGPMGAKVSRDLAWKKTLPSGGRPGAGRR